MLPVGSSRDTNAVTTNREGFVATALTGMIPLCEDWLTDWVVWWLGLVVRVGLIPVV